MESKRILIVCLLFVFKTSFGQDSIICDQCGLKNRIHVLNEIVKQRDSVKIIIDDYFLSYSQSVVIQFYLNNNPLTFSEPAGTRIYPYRYYRKFYNKLKDFESVVYTGHKDESNLIFALKVIYIFTEKDSIKSDDDADVFNTIFDILYLDKYNIDDYNLNTYGLDPKKLKELIFFIQYNINTLNIFTDKKTVINICNSIEKTLKSNIKPPINDERLIFHW